MKKSSPVANRSPQFPWRVLAILSLTGNLGLLIWAWKVTTRPVGGDPVTATYQQASAEPAKPAASPPASGPYAALGSFMAENNRIPDLGWTEAQFAEFLRGFRSSYEGRGVAMDDDAKKLRDEISQRVQKMLAAEQPNPAEEYFRMLREKEGVTRTPSGLHYRVTEPGYGPTAQASDTVVISFAARLPDGQELPALSRARTRTPVKGLLPGLAEGVQLLRVGGKALLYLPPDLSFTEESWPAQLPKGAPLAFFVELHEIVPPAG